MNFDSGRASSIGGINIRNRRGSDLTGIRFADNRSAPTSTNDLMLYRRSNGLYFWNGSTEYNLLTGVVGGVGDMNAVYEGGRTVTVDEGAIIYNDATTGSANVLEFNKTGAGSGNILDFDFTAAFTGQVLNLDMGSAVSAVGIQIDSEGGARTGADIQITDDSTGTHIALDINKSGSGATTGLDYQESYNGSSASFAVKITLDANDGLDTTGMQIVRNAGIRTVPAIDINDSSTGSANIIDIDVSGVYTGDIVDIVTSAAATGNAIHVDLDSAVAMTALRMEGSGVRTQPYLELISDSTGSAVYMDIDVDGAGSGNVIDITTSTTFTGSLIGLNLNGSTGGVAITIDGSNEIRTANLIAITNDGSGNTDVVEIADSNTGAGHVWDINTSGIGSGNVLDITYSVADTGNALNVVMADNVAGAALNITGAGARTDSIIEVSSAETGSIDGMVYFVTTGVFTGHMLTVHSDAAATTGGLVHLDLDAGVAYKALTIDLAGARTVEIALVTMDGTFGSGAGGTFLNLDVSMSGASASPLFDIDLSGVYTGNIFDFATASASTGTIFEVNMTNAVAARVEVQTLAGTRTVNANTVTHSAAGAVDIYQIDDSGTSSGHVWDVNVSGNSTGNVLDIVMSTSRIQGHTIHVDMATDLAGNAILIDAAGTRTAPIIYIANTGADGGTDDHVLFINQTGILDSNLVQLTFGTAASTGEAISIAMDTNVAGRAIAITSAATGVSGEGAGLDITHTGDLVSGAHVVEFISTGSPSSTSHVLSVQQTTGAGSAGAYAVYINATGANVEGLKVDAGAVVFDETLLVTGTTTLGAVVYTSFNDGTTTLLSTALELNRAADVSTRLMAAGATETVALATHEAKIVLLDTLAGSVVTLPAATGSGAVYRFIVSVVATSNSHVIQVVGTDIMSGAIWFCDTDTAGTTTAFATAADSDTITLNRTTTGSVKIGEYIELIDAVSGTWCVRGFLTNSGSGATPFSAAV